MFDPTKPVQTRDGRKARIVATDIKGGRYTIWAAVTDISGTERQESYTEDGEYIYDDENDSDFDLINIPEKRQRYINIYGEHPAFSTRDEADANAGGARTECIRIEYEDGQFDD